jgi:hypothetical protein
MSKIYVKVLPSATVTEAFKLLHDNQQNCALVVDPEDYLEGIITLGDIRRIGFELHEESFIDGDYPKTDVCLHGERNFFLPIKNTAACFKNMAGSLLFIKKEWIFFYYIKALAHRFGPTLAI